MKKSGLIFILAIVLNIPFCYPQYKTKDKTARITYIANEGFLINVGDKSILIDALFGEKEMSYCDIPESDQIDAMVNAKDPYSQIDLIAVTHRHGDHLYTPFVLEHISNNKEGNFISCEQVIHKIEDSGNKYNIKSQLIEITPDSLTFTDTTINDIQVRVYRLVHLPYYVTDPETGKKINRHQGVQNLGFLFEINGIKIFHSGDSDHACITDYSNFRLDKENIDIAILQRGFMWCADCQGTEIVRQFIKPKHIILMHIEPGQQERLINVANELKDEFPSAMVFDKRMETKTYTFK